MCIHAVAFFGFPHTSPSFSSSLPRKMLKFTCSNKTKHATFAALFLTALGMTATAHAQSVLVPGTVTGNGTTGYTYNYSVTDATTMELAIVTVPTAANSALMQLIAPAGFEITYDAGNGLVSLLEDNSQATTQTFAAGSTVAGFSFTSFIAPGTVTFDALDISANDYMGTTVSAVPEPTSTALLLAGVILAGGFLVRRRIANQPALVQ